MLTSCAAFLRLIIALLPGEGLFHERLPMIHSLLQQQHAVVIGHDLVLADHVPALGPQGELDEAVGLLAVG